MKPLEITCSSFDSKTKELIHNIINKLGATYNDNLSLETNVLVASTVNSPKYVVHLIYLLYSIHSSSLYN